MQDSKKRSRESEEKKDSIDSDMAAEAGSDSELVSHKRLELGAGRAQFSCVFVSLVCLVCLPCESAVTHAVPSQLPALPLIEHYFLLLCCAVAGRAAGRADSVATMGGEGKLFKILIPKASTGVVIGKKGANITALSTEVSSISCTHISRASCLFRVPDVDSCVIGLRAC